MDSMEAFLEGIMHKLMAEMPIWGIQGVGTEEGGCREVGKEVQAGSTWKVWREESVQWSTGVRAAQGG